VEERNGPGGSRDFECLDVGRAGEVYGHLVMIGVADLLGRFRALCSEPRPRAHRPPLSKILMTIFTAMWNICPGL